MNVFFIDERKETPQQQKLFYRTPEVAAERHEDFEHPQEASVLEYPTEDLVKYYQRPDLYRFYNAL